MNKLQGFYELKRIGIPAAPWNVFTGEELLDPSLLWTIRVATKYGNDINLPRAIGVTAEEAKKKGQEFLEHFKKNGIVIYYPYFIALKSGILETRENMTIIESVKDDLWNLTTKGYREVTVIIDKRTKEKLYNGSKYFLNKKEINQLLLCSSRIRVKYKDYIFDKSSIIAEWSYACSTDIEDKPIGEKYLVFYECREISHKYK
ncbi:MAG: hypothetical protein FH756_16115 [Firmicutes bacterium]|nr:hypothetical protein [Bacillota bacterium]